MAHRNRATSSTTSADQFKDVNADADTLEEGMKSLQQMIIKRIAKLSSEPDYPIRQDLIPIVTRIIKNYVRLFPNYDKDEKVVEAWGLIWAYRNDGKLLWSLKVIWDSDKPVQEQYRPHYGYEFLFNDKHFGGPGHIWLNGETPLHHRDANPMHEELKHQYHAQEFVGEGTSQIRLDHAMRLWGLGLDSELLNEPGFSYNKDDYNKIVMRPPASWQSYEQPSFGRVDNSLNNAPRGTRASQDTHRYDWDEACNGAFMRRNPPRARELLHDPEDDLDREIQNKFWGT